jgi:hypothetical protein
MPTLVSRRLPKSARSIRRPKCRRVRRTDSAPVCGAGACSVSGCPCKAFQSSYGNDLCGNCGHQYTAHW